MSDIHTQILLIIRSISNDLYDLCSTSDIILYTLHQPHSGPGTMGLGICLQRSDREELHPMCRNE